MGKVILFTTPRPFEGHYDLIQRNAFWSWSMLAPLPGQIAIFASQEYEGEKALVLARLYESANFTPVPVLARSSRGVPLMDDLFPRAQELAGDGICCYVNADIILREDAVAVLRQAAETVRQETGSDKALMIARRWNVQVFDRIGFEPGQWWQALWEKVQEQGSLMAECAIDLFAWYGRPWQYFKPFAIGRYRWDNWLVGMALHWGSPVVDITAALPIIHQSHAQVPWEDPDARDNFAIPGVLAGTKDSTHTLLPDGKLIGGWHPGSG